MDDGRAAEDIPLGAAGSKGAGPGSHGGARAPGSATKMSGVFRSAEAVPAAKRRKHTSSEEEGAAAIRRLLSAFPDAASAYSAGMRLPELPLLQGLLDLEQAIDIQLWRKKMDVQEALIGTDSWVPRTLRFFVSSSNRREGEGGAQDRAKAKAGEAAAGREEPKAGEASAAEAAEGAGAGHPWRLQVYARILEGSPLDSTSTLGASNSERGDGEGGAADSARASLIESTLTSAFMQNVKRLEIQVGDARLEVEPGTEGVGGGNKVVWVPNRLLDSGQGRKDGASGAAAGEAEAAPPLMKAGVEALAGGALVISGHAKEDFVAEVKVDMQYRPERYRLANDLQQLLGVDIDTRPRVLQALWHYIKANRLQDPKEPGYVNCDEPLQRLFREPRVKMTALSNKLTPHLRTPVPMIIQHRVKVAEGVPSTTPATTVDVSVSVPPPGEADSVAALAGLDSAYRDIRVADEGVAHELAKVEDRQKRRTALLAFAHAPVDFVNAAIASQSTDVSVIAAAATTDKQLTRSSLFTLPWAEDAALKYLQRQMVNEAGNGS